MNRITVRSPSFLSFIAVPVFVLGTLAVKKLMHSERSPPPIAVGKASRVDKTHVLGSSEWRPKDEVRMRYYIGEHDGIEHPFDHNRFRAYFYWREGDVPRVRSFSVEQLREHIAERRTRGEWTRKFELALDRLMRMNQRSYG
jgi:hypothetical protein